MKKILYALLVIVYFTVAYLSVYILPHYYVGAIMGAAGANLGASFRQFKAVKTSPEKPLLAYFKWDKKSLTIILLFVLGLILFASLILEFNWQYGLAFLVGISYGALWQIIHLQFLRKYYFKNA